MSDNHPSAGAEPKPAEDAEKPVFETQAEGFQAVRDAHRSEIAEDYVELIQELIEQNGEARPVDIAERMGVRQPTVAKNLARLQRDGLIQRERYRSVFLTESGWALAETCRERHRIVVAFLLSLGLDRETAEQDAEGIEHHVSDRTLAAFRRAMNEADGEGRQALDAVARARQRHGDMPHALPAVR